jgi:hypothetical protein
VVVGEGDGYEEALAEVKPAIQVPDRSLCDEVRAAGTPLLEAFVAETTIPA